MNKKMLILMTGALLAGVGAANASDFNQYVSAKLSRAKIQNDAKNDFVAIEGAIHGTIVDKKIKDNVWGTRLAYGVEEALTNDGKIRAELEYGYNDTAKNHGSFYFQHLTDPTGGLGAYEFKSTIQTFMLNGYYDYQVNDIFTPYVGAGLGVSHIRTEGNIALTLPFWPAPVPARAKSSNDRFAWNISAGTAVKITDSVAADLGYRYTNYGQIKSSAASGYSKYTFDSHELYVGLRYTF